MSTPLVHRNYNYHFIQQEFIEILWPACAVQLMQRKEKPRFTGFRLTWGVARSDPVTTDPVGMGL